jgi:hypothetical protein
MQSFSVIKDELYALGLDAYVQRSGELLLVRLEINTIADSFAFDGERVLFRATEPWEKNSVVEGPFVVKCGRKYALTYSACDFRNPDYAVGVAFADRPEGPWKKSGKNPILQRFRGLEGTGHHSLFKDKSGKWCIVFHAHEAPGRVGLRRTYIADLVVRGTSAAPELSVGGELIACMIGE